MLAPESWGAYQRNDCRKPRLLHLSIHRKALNFLTWDIWFSLINNNLLMFRLSAFCCETSILPGSFLCLLRACFSGLFKILSSGLEVLKIPTKWNIILNFGAGDFKSIDFLGWRKILFLILSLHTPIRKKKRYTHEWLLKKVVYFPILLFPKAKFILFSNYTIFPHAVNLWKEFLPLKV